MEISECPEDFFSDTISSDNFLLRLFVRLIANWDVVLNGDLYAKRSIYEKELAKFKAALEARFKLNIEHEVQKYEEQREEEDEYAPVVVDYDL
ncbi:hypothetical protein HDU96_008342 [Phlyctochytrium bullatum]|nr:hypothetical protein HDU96_008342 [Phlyctochytrium bullatum]